MAKYLCKCCQQVVESKHRHDWRQLKNCENETYVDGGDVYMRVGGHDLSLIVPLKNPIFVFGSNRQGRHGKGAALDAKTNWGAINLQPRGLQGSSYAIVTKELRRSYRGVSLLDIGKEVEEFKKFAAEHPDLTFVVTKIGCGLAGFKPEEIGPLFAGSPSNVLLPKEFQ